MYILPQYHAIVFVVFEDFLIFIDVSQSAVKGQLTATKYFLETSFKCFTKQISAIIRTNVLRCFFSFRALRVMGKCICRHLFFLRTKVIDTLLMPLSSTLLRLIYMGYATRFGATFLKLV